MSAQQDAVAGPTAIMAGSSPRAARPERAPALTLRCTDAAVAVPQGHPLMARFTGVAMKVPYAVMVGGHGRDWESDWSYMARDYDTVGSLIHMTFARCDAIVNEWNNGSVVTTALNAAAAPSEIALPAELAEVLRTCEQVHAISGGRFDPTVGALCGAWRAALCSAREPAPLSAAEVARLMECVGWGRAFRIDAAGERASKQVEGAALALGGVAKGWCVRPCSQAAALCVQSGCSPMRAVRLQSPTR
jgi:thiamine biosynthesis lipoprotein ApbE